MTADLKSAVGLPLRLELATGAVQLGDGVEVEKTGERRLSDLEPVLRDPSQVSPAIAYRLYRGVRHASDGLALDLRKLRYDLTVTLPGTHGGEFAKTAGHYHPPAAESALSFPEVYEVVHGQAAFVLQHVETTSAETPRVLGVWVQICEALDRIIIPPNCGHVTVNIGSTPLAVADLISTRCGHVYEPFRRLRGAAYYVIPDDAAEHKIRLERNPAYDQAPDPVVNTGSRSDIGGEGVDPLYRRFRARPDDFGFLSDPEMSAKRHLDLWKNGSSRL